MTVELNRVTDLDTSTAAPFGHRPANFSGFVRAKDARLVDGDGTGENFDGILNAEKLNLHTQWWELGTNEVRQA